MTRPTRLRTRKSALALAAAAALTGGAPSPSAQAAACAWTPVSGNWGVAANWTCAVVPRGPAIDSASVSAGKTVTIDDAESPGVFRSIFTLNNAGTVQIDAFGLTLQGGGSTTNSGTILVGGASTAALQMSHGINNAGGVIHVANGSVLNQFAGALSGGTVNTTGNGALVSFSNTGNVLSGITLNGRLDLQANVNARNRIASGLTLNGAADIGDSGILSLDGSLTPGGNQAIGGNATFNLNGPGARLAVEGSGSTTLGSSVVVRGQGNIGQALHAGGNHTLVNHGRISADVAGGSLSLVPPANGGGSSIANAGVLDARNGGTLLIGTTVDNTGGLINAQTGSFVVLNGTSVSGGTLGSAGTGAIRVISNTGNFLSGTTLTGTLDMTSIANARQRLVNGNTLDGGTIHIGNGGILSLDSSQSTGNAASLAGSGTVHLDDAGARLAIEGSGTSQIGAGVTVRGQGNIGQPLLVGGNNTFTNHGLVSADVGGGTLDITPPASGGGSSFINNGTLQAINGGTLLLSSPITTNPGGQIVAGAGSQVVQNGVRLNGTLAASGSGSFTASSNTANVLDGVVFSGTLDLAATLNARQRIANGATINGVVNIANGAILSLDSSLTAGGSQTIGGNATFNLNDPGARLAVEGSGATTLGANVVVRGQGNIGQPLLVGGNHTLTNNGLVSADVAGGTLNIVTPANGGGSSFVNNGTLQAINGGTLLLSSAITTNPGGQIVAGAGSQVVQNGVRLSGTMNTSGSGSFTASSNTANVMDGVVFSGTLDLAATANARQRISNGATINGVVSIANGAILSLDGSLTSGGNQTIGGAATFNLDDPTARLAVEGSGTTTLGANAVVRGQGNVGQPLHVGGNHTLVNNGRISADVAGGSLNLVNPASGGGSLLVNSGLLDARNGGTLTISTPLDNTGGLVNARTGSVVLLNGTTVTGGTLGSAGTGAIRASSNTGNFLSGTTLTGTLDITSIVNGRQRLINGNTLNGGAIHIGNGGILSLDSSQSTGNAASLTGTGTVHLDDAGARLAIEGSGTSQIGAGVTVRGQGNIGQPLLVGGNHTLTNHGVIVADVGGGTLAIVNPASGGGSALRGTGTLQVNGGALNLATGSASQQGQLVIGGAGSFNLSNPLTLSGDYTNAQAGSGSSFNRRAAVTGAGQILAGGDASQRITGAAVTGGSTPNATLTIGNVHVGANSYGYTIGNDGTTGPTLRGAVQTTVNGASLTDARLSGSGVTAGNFNAGGPGGAGEGRTVVFTAATAGALAPLTGQVLNLRSNFENISDQKLNIVLGAGAAAYHLAAGNAAGPVVLPNQRVNGTATAALGVTNTAPTGAFTEDLNASISSVGGPVTANGAVNGLLAGASSNALQVGVATGSAGAKSGTVNLGYVSTGTVNGASNSLGATAVGGQAVTVSGNVYQPAAGQLVGHTLNFGTLQVGQQVSQNLVVRNTASGPAGFVEDLNASFGASGNAQISGSGSLAGITAGSTSTGAHGTMTVTITGANAGALNSGIAVNYVSAGRVGGVSNGLGELAVGSETFAVNGAIAAVANVINQASPLIANPSINLGAVRVGAASLSAQVQLSNQATAAPQAALSASIAPNGAPVTAAGSVSLLAPGASSSALQVGLNTAVAGVHNGSATVSLVSDASNIGGCAPNCQLTLAPQTVAVTGKVYTPAIGQLATPMVDFGIVRVGDTVNARHITVSNGAAVTALNDTLRASVSGLGGAVSAGPAATGIGAQASGQISVGLNTASAGVVQQTGSVGFLSQNADMADLGLGSTAVEVRGQVNRLAHADFDLLSGAGLLSVLGNGDYLLDLGQLQIGSNGHWMLQLDNEVSGPADLLRGLFDLGAADDFTPTGFGAVDHLAAGQAQGGLALDFHADRLGQFEDEIAFRGFSYNASDPDGIAQNRRLLVRAFVIDDQGGGGGNVPEPAVASLLLAAALAAHLARRRGGRFHRAVRTHT